MKLQIALDEITLVDGLVLVEKVSESIDIIELGTPLILEEGMRAVKEFRRYFPQKEILADLKIMDGGEYEADMAYDAGADYITVMGVTDILTIKGCLRAAQKHKKEVVVDMMCVPQLNRRIQQLEEAGVTAMAVHIGVDQQAAGRTPADDLELMKKHSRNSKIWVAGGISLETIPTYKELGADVIIVGGGIKKAKDPAEEAMAICNKIKE